ncbi:MAG: hypothetical protein IKE41_00135, partial [Clostridia bacterium]|nr:hypothetical protein [Clostridia bacterium]
MALMLNPVTLAKPKNRKKYSGRDVAPDNLEVITLCYNGKDKMARAIVNLIEESGVFDILRD